MFSEDCTQEQVFDRLAFPLVADLVQGKNGKLSGLNQNNFARNPPYTGLLFAYGITNSGKTYTMNGEPEEAGILPRSLDVIFNTIADVQAPKFVSCYNICLSADRTVKVGSKYDTCPQRVCDAGIEIDSIHAFGRCVMRASSTCTIILL